MRVTIAGLSCYEDLAAFNETIGELWAKLQRVPVTRFTVPWRRYSRKGRPRQQHGNGRVFTKSRCLVGGKSGEYS